MVDRVVPMLPQELSNGLCSLNAGEDKLTLSCIMEIDAQGNVTAQKMENTVIRSAHRLTYGRVNRLLEGDAEEREKYTDIADTLMEMNRLAKILRARRFEKGSIDFNIDEPEIILDRKGVPVDVTVRKRGDAEKLIEEFMLRANITVAEQYYYMELPFLYRIHEHPDADRMKELAIFLGNFGIQLKGFQNVHPHAIQEVLEKVAGTTEETIVNTVTLRALKKSALRDGTDLSFRPRGRPILPLYFADPALSNLQVHRIIKALLGGVWMKDICGIWRKCCRKWRHSRARGSGMRSKRSGGAGPQNDGVYVEAYWGNLPGSGIGRNEVWHLCGTG